MIHFNANAEGASGVFTPVTAPKQPWWSLQSRFNWWLKFQPEHIKRLARNRRKG